MKADYDMNLALTGGASEPGAAQAISFAIPSSTAQWVVSQLLSHGRVRRSAERITRHVVPTEAP